MENPWTTRPTLLVVEDDDDLRTLTAEVFADGGYAVVAAKHGGEAITLLSGGVRPDLVVLDLRMPIVSGPSLIAWLRAQPTLEHVPVLVVSSRRPFDVALDHAVQGWILKPASERAMLAAVGQQLLRGAARGGPHASRARRSRHA